jgi:hypothetical protein
MGLVPKCKGQHRPDSPHHLQLNNIHTLLHVRIRNRLTNSLMQVRNNYEQHTNVNIGRIHHTISYKDVIHVRVQVSAKEHFCRAIKQSWPAAEFRLYLNDFRISNESSSPLKSCNCACWKPRPATDLHVMTTRLLCSRNL